MKRPKPPNARPKRYEQNIRKAYTTEQLAEIGAIALLYNQLESFVDFMLLVVLHLPPSTWLPVVKRINGMDGKLEILRRYAADSFILTDEAKQCVKNALDAIGEYKGYRDAIVHSIPFDVDQGIAQRIGSRAEVTQVIVQIDALKAVSQRMELLLREMQEIDMLFRLADQAGAMAIYGGKVRDPVQRRRTQDVPIQLAQALEHQNRRLALPPLPEFPEEDVVPPQTAQ